MWQTELLATTCKSETDSQEGSASPRTSAVHSKMQNPLQTHLPRVSLQFHFITIGCALPHPMAMGTIEVSDREPDLMFKTIKVVILL